MLAVKREVVLEHEHREFRSLEWIGLRPDCHRSLTRGDRSSTHAVAAIGIACRSTGRCITGNDRIGSVARENSDVVALGGIQIHLARIQWRLLGAGSPADS